MSIEKEFMQDKCRTIIKNSKKEANFLLKLTKAISNIDTSHLTSKDSLKTVVQEYARLSESIWFKHLCNVNITKCSKCYKLKSLKLDK